jgi:hypothetical protein
VLPISVWEDHFDLTIQSHLMGLVHRTAEVCAYWHEQSSSSSAGVQPSKIASILLEAKTTAVELELWSDRTSSEWTYQAGGRADHSYQREGGRYRPSLSAQILQFQGAVGAAQWSFFRACCILLHQVIFQCCHLLLSRQKAASLNSVSWLQQGHGLIHAAEIPETSSAQCFEEALHESFKAIMNMTQSVCENIVQILPDSTSTASSVRLFPRTGTPQKRATSDEPNFPSSGPSIQKCALLVPLWAALSSYRMIIEAEEQGTLPVSSSAWGVQEIRQRCHWLESATDYIHGDLGMVQNRRTDETEFGSQVLETPQSPGFTRIMDWLEGF